MGTVVEAHRLGKSFGRAFPLFGGSSVGKTVFSGVELRVDEGERVAIVGSNGAGKSTLLRILATVLLPTAGELHLWGVPVTDGTATRLRRRIGWVGDDQRSFFWRLTGAQNLRFFASLHGITGRDLDERLRRFSALLGMGEYLEKPVRSYSKGMRQRLALARGMFHYPDLLLLDEPFQSLDDEGREAFWEAVAEVEAVRGRPMTVIVAAPHVDFPARVLVLAHRTLSEDGP